MTVVLAIVTEEYSILMTDTRISFEKGAGSSFNDSAVKLKSLNYPQGWFAGCGYSPFLGNFYELVTGCFSTTRQQYLDNLLQVSLELINNNPETIEDIRTSICFRSYLSDDNLVIDLFRIQANDRPEVGPLLNNRIAIAFPSHYTEEVEVVNKYSIYSKQSGDFSEILIKMLTIFKEISSNSDGVSDICEVGILKKDGLTKKYSFSGKIDDLLKSEIKSFG